MTSDTRPPGGRRPPTIDLQATEIESKPVEPAATPAEATSPTGPAAEASDAPPTAPADAGEAAAAPEAVEPGATTQAAPAPEPEKASASGTDSRPAAAPAAPARRGFGWLALFMSAVVGGAVAAAVLAVTGQLSGTDTTPLEARLAGLDQRLRDMAARPVAGGADTAALDELRERLAKLEAGSAT